MSVVVIRDFSCYRVGDLLNPPDDQAKYWIDQSLVVADKDLAKIGESAAARRRRGATTSRPDSSAA